MEVVLVSRQLLPFYTFVRLHSSRAGHDSGGTPLSLPAGSDQGLHPFGNVAYGQPLDPRPGWA